MLQACNSGAQRCNMMRAWVIVVAVGFACNAQAARELKWGWSSSNSLGQLSTTTGANTNSGLLSTCALHRTLPTFWHRTSSSNVLQTSFLG